MHGRNMWKITGKAICCVFLLSPLNASASASYLYNMYSAVSAGDAGAGGAALATDATTLYLNPAGMVRIPQKQLVVSGSIVNTAIKFSGTGTWSAQGVGSYAQNGVANGGAVRFLPELFYVYPTTKPFNFGFSLTAPFGLGTYYSPLSNVRYSATTSELKVIDLSPNISYKITDQWAVGLGLDADYMNLRLRAMAGIPIISTSLDSLSENEANGWGYGWHAGVLYQPTSTTRFGYGYRSYVSADLVGNSNITSSISGFFASSDNTASTDNFNTTFVLPPINTLSGYHEINTHWAIDGSISYLQWSQLPENLVANNIAAIPVPSPPISASLPQNYKNTWTLAGGGIYKVNPDWLLRGGMFWDQSPIKSNTERTVNLPDSNRIGLSIGMHGQPNKQVGIDVGWTHIIFNSVTNTTTAISFQTANANGNFHNYADVIAGQVVWDIG